jgi:hypothetical protein
MPRANIQTSVKTNLTRNCNLDTKNQFTRTTELINFTGSTIIIKINKTIESFLILEDITQ